MDPSRSLHSLRFGLALASLVLATALASASVRLFVSIQGKRAGQAVASQKLMPDGTKVVQLSIQLAGPGGNKVTLRSESMYSAKGAPLRMFHESVTTKPATRRTVTVSFTKGGANVVEEVGGKRSTKLVPLAPGAPLEAKSEFWFLRDQPKPGAVDRHYRFDVSSLTWEITTSTYVGKKSIAIAGKPVSAHEVQSTKGIAYLDAAGLPVKLDMGEITLERAPGQ